MMKPFMIVLGRTRNSIRQRRRMIVYIKPLGPPVTNLTTGSIRDIFPRHFRSKLKIGSNNRGNIQKVWIRVQEEKTLEQIKVRVDSKKSLAQMNKNGNMEDGSRSQMMKLDPPEKEETPEEVVDGNPQSTLHKGLKHNSFRNPFIWSIVSLSRKPLNNRPRTEKSTTDKG